MHSCRVLVTLFLAGCAAATPRGTNSGGAELPTARELEADFERLTRLARADDARTEGGGGEGAGGGAITPAMSFVSARLAALGIAPAGDSGYVQRVPVVERRVAETTVLEVVTPTASRRLRTGDELTPLLSLGAGMPAPRLTATGPVVFAGYALGERGEGEPGAEAAEALVALPLAGSVVVAVMGAPRSAGALVRARLEAPEQVAERLQRLFAARPAAVVLLFPEHMGATYRALRRAGEVAVSLESGERTLPGQRLLPPVFVGPAVAGSPLLPSGWPLNEAPGVLEGHRFRAEVVEASVVRPSYNVIGRLRGADPLRAGRMIALGASGPWGRRDAGAGSAMDGRHGPMDVSDVVMLLAAARALRAGPVPARSVLFVFHPGGESSRSGAEWFARDSTVPMDSIDVLLAPMQLARGTGDSVLVSATGGGARMPGIGRGAAAGGRRDVPPTIVDSVNATLVRPLTIVPWSRASAARGPMAPPWWPWVRAGVPVLRLSAPSALSWLREHTVDPHALTRSSALLVELARAFADRHEDTAPTTPR